MCVCVYVCVFDGTPSTLSMSPHLVVCACFPLPLSFVSIYRRALGILIYELLVGETPFADRRQNKIFEKIIHSAEHLKFERDFPSDARDLVVKLLHPTLSLRLGLLRGGAEDIMNHAWFQNSNFDWNAHASQQATAPFVPPINGKLDTSMFDPYPEDDSVETYRGDQAPFETF